MTAPKTKPREETTIQPDVAQRNASNPAASVWVGASAGSGKTKVLADRVIRLLLAGVQPQRILCLTFTRAAAAEMSIRITQQLARWATCEEDALREELDTLQSPQALMPEQLTDARRLFARVLNCPGGMRIHTIHAFGQEILRRFPLEAGLPPHFELLEETDANALWAEAQNDVLRAASSAPESPEGKALEKLVRETSEENFSSLLKETVRDASRLSESMEKAGGFKQRIADMRSLLDLDPKETENGLRAKAVSEKSLPEKDIRHAAKMLAEKGSKTYKPRGEAILLWLEHDKRTRAENLETYIRVFLTKEGEPYAKPANKELLEEHPELESIVARETARLLSLNERLDTVRLAEQTESILTLAWAIAGRYAKRKKTSAALDYDDLIRHTDELLRRPGIAPWVLFKLDGGIDHILVDEAQDTSPDQWKIILALVEEFFAGRGARDDADRTIFVVGDEKQSIYSFLKADPNEFHRVREYLKSRIIAAQKTYKEVPLNISFRSAPAILRAVDAVFTRDETRQGVSLDPVRHEAFHCESSGRVEIWPLIPAPEKETPEWKLPLDYEPDRNPIAELAEIIATRIEAWHRKKTPIYDRKEKTSRPMNYSDVMILVRKRGKGGGIVEHLIRRLKEKGIPVTGADRMKLTEQLAVMDLMALMQFMLLPEDDLTLACVLRGPLLGCAEDQLMELAIGRKTSLWESLKEKTAHDKNLAPACRYLENMLAITDEITPFALLVRILSAPCPADDRSGRHAIVRRLGPDALDPIDEILNAAQRFSQHHTPSLQAFLHWTKTTEAEIKREMDPGAGQVRIATVHGAKGLEAPIVILPDAASVPRKTDLQKILWHPERHIPFYIPREPQNAMLRGLRDAARQKQLEEYRRLLYVAMTRAADRLIIAGWETKKQEDSAQSWYVLTRAALEPHHEPPALEQDSPIVPEIVLTDPKPISCTAGEGGGQRSWEGEGVFQEITLPPWSLRPPDPEPIPPRPLTPSRPDDEEPPLITPGDARFERGRIIHRLLQSLPDLDPAHQEPAAKRYLSNPQLRLNEAQQKEISREVFALLKHPDFAPLFGPDSRAEVPIVGIVKDRVIAGQVDRLCIRKDEVWIVDYKTNRPPPENARKVPQIYIKQLDAYKTVLRAIYSDKNIRVFLLWTYNVQLMEL